MPPVTVPSFARSVTHDLEWTDGRSLRFHEISARALLKIEAVADVLKGAAMTLLGESATPAERASAMLEVFKVAGQDPDLVGYLILDALRDEPWNTTRPPTQQAIDAFLNAVDGPVLVLMIGALAAVNLKAAVPLLQRLAGSALGAQPGPTSPASSTG